MLSAPLAAPSSSSHEGSLTLLIVLLGQKEQGWSLALHHPEQLWESSTPSQAFWPRNKQDHG